MPRLRERSEETFPFVVYAMAQDGVFFAPAGRLDPRTGRPAFAGALQGALACVAVLVGASRIDVLLTGIAFADATFLAVIAVVHVWGRAHARYAPQSSSPGRACRPIPPRPSGCARSES